MKWKAASLAAVLCLGAQTQAKIMNLGPQGVNRWKLDYSQSAQNSRLFVHDSQSHIHPELKGRDSDENPGGFPVQWFQQPLDHFNPKLEDVFNQRYWVNARHYRPRKGAPVILFGGGETNAEVCP